MKPTQTLKQCTPSHETYSETTIAMLSPTGNLLREYINALPHSETIAMHETYSETIAMHATLAKTLPHYL